MLWLPASQRESVLSVRFGMTLFLDHIATAYRRVLQVREPSGFVFLSIGLYVYSFQIEKIDDRSNRSCVRVWDRCG